MNCGNKVVEYRGKILLIQKELEVILNVGVASAVRWGNGYYEPTIKVKRRIKTLLLEAGIKVDN